MLVLDAYSLFMEEEGCSNLKGLVELRAGKRRCFDDFSLKGLNKEKIHHYVTITALPLHSLLLFQNCPSVVPNVLSLSSSGDIDPNLDSEKCNDPAEPAPLKLLM